MIMILSVILIIYISIDTFKDRDFLENHNYMTFQFWVCIIFLADFFIELFLSDNKWDYIKARWIFLLISIPYLNILNTTHLHVSHDALYVLRFVPLLRGVMALGIVLSFISNNKFVGIFVTYLAVLLLVTYFCSIIFYQLEYKINSSVNSYIDAFYWGCTQVTTLGCNIYPITTIGHILCCVLSGMGIIMFPLFTVYATNTINHYLHRDGPEDNNADHSSDPTTSTSTQIAPATINT